MENFYDLEDYCWLWLWLPSAGNTSYWPSTFVSVPLTIQVADQVFVDDASLDIDQMMETMYATAEASKSACPSPDDICEHLKEPKTFS